MKGFCKKWTAALAVIIVLALALLIFLWDFGAQTKLLVEQELHAHMEDILDQSVFSLKKNMGFLTDKLQVQARIFNMHAEMTSEEIITELKHFAKNEDITRATIVALDGTVYSSEFGLQKVYPVPFEEAFTRSGVHISEPRYLDSTDQYLIDMVTPVSINNKKFGAISISYDQANFQKIFSVTFIEGNCTINLVTEEGLIISRIGDDPIPANYRNNYKDFFENNDVELIGSTLESLKSLQDASSPRWIKYENKQVDHCVCYMPVGINDWYIATVASREAAQVRAHGIENMANVLAARIIGITVLVALIFILYYIREHKMLERLKDSYRLALKKSNDLFYEVDLENDMVKNHSAKNRKLFLGIEEPRYSRAISQYSKFCAPENKACFLEYFSLEHLKKVSQGKDSCVSLEYKVTSEDQVDYWFEATVMPMVSNAKGTQNIICIQNDITKQKLRTESLQNAARMDGLTGLYNKVTTQELIEEFIKFEGRDGNHALIMMDIDYFKEVNDRFGHAKGDIVIAQFSELLSDVFRKSDILGRMGGDEFIAFLKDYSSIELVAAKAQQINDKFCKVQFDDTGECCKTSVSIGVALFKVDGDNFETLFKNADAALYASKKKGRDRFSFYSKE